MAKIREEGKLVRKKSEVEDNNHFTTVQVYTGKLTANASLFAVFQR
jgi:hypothetical protein